MNFSVKNIIIYFIGFFIFFSIVYFESTTLLDIKFAYIWKIALMSYFAYYVLIHRKGQKYLFLRMGYFLSIKQILSIGGITYLFDSVISAFKFAIFPLFTDYLLASHIKSSTLKRTLIFFSSYIILSGIPFYLGLLESPNVDPISLSEYGGIEGETAFSGIFQGSSPASASIAFSVLILLFYQSREKKILIRLLYWFVIGVGLFFLYNTYVRTGWLIFVVGFFYFNLNNNKLSSLIKSLPIIAIFIYLMTTLYYENQMFYNRINDIRTNQDSDAKSYQEKVGSGRLSILGASFSIFADGTFEQQTLGFGNMFFLDEMQKKYKELFPHNGFVNILVVSGIIGIILFISMLFSIYRTIKNFRNRFHKKLAFILFYSYIIFNLTQGGNNWFLDVPLALILALLIKEKDESISSNESNIYESSNISRR